MNKITERRQLDELLRLLYSDSDFDEIIVTEGEKPDFSIDIDGKKIGIEVSDGTPSQFIKTMSSQLLQSESRVFINMTDALRYNNETTADGLVIEACQNTECLPYGEWVKSWMHHVRGKIANKRKKFQNYTKFEENWLLIYDDIYIGDYDFKTLFESGQHNPYDLIVSSENHQSDFNVIFIRSERCIAKFQRQSDGNKFQLFLRSSQPPNLITP